MIFIDRTFPTDKRLHELNQKKVNTMNISAENKKLANQAFNLFHSIRIQIESAKRSVNKERLNTLKTKAFKRYQRRQDKVYS